ncbi:MAG: hypothetical protein ACI978_000994 [Oleispira sp.]|jgi:hypothetical protein
MNLYHFEIENSVDLYQLNDGRFQIIKKGVLAPIMIGYKYILVEKDIATYFMGLGIDRVSFEPAIVWDRKSDSENIDYVSMRVNHHFDTTDIGDIGDIGDIDCSGTQFLIYDNQQLFVSCELKVELEKLPYKFTFTEGFSHFA